MAKNICSTWLPGERPPSNYDRKTAVRNQTRSPNLVVVSALFSPAVSRGAGSGSTTRQSIKHIKRQRSHWVTPKFDRINCRHENASSACTTPNIQRTRARTYIGMRMSMRTQTIRHTQRPLGPTLAWAQLERQLDDNANTELTRCQVGSKLLQAPVRIST